MKTIYKSLNTNNLKLLLMKLAVAKLKTVALIVLATWSITGFAQGKMMYMKKDGVTVFQSPISEIDSIVFKQVTNDDNCSVYDDPQGVVINGVRWATRNVGAPGAFASSPCDDGGYYQFNKGTTDFLFGDDYWNSVYANSDTWLPANDPSPAGWRVPTFDEIKKLLDINYVTYEWIDNNGLTGGKFTDKATGNSIFLPAAGWRFSYGGGTLWDVGWMSYYWSSTVYDAVDTYILYFYDGYAYAIWISNLTRGDGFNVRPVAK